MPAITAPLLLASFVAEFCRNGQDGGSRSREPETLTSRATESLPACDAGPVRHE